MSSIWNKYCERGGRCVFHPEDRPDGTSGASVYIKLLDRLYETASGDSYIRDVEINTALSELIGLLFAETIYEEGQQPTVEMNAGGVGIDVGEIKSYIDTHYQEPLSLEGLAERFYFSKHYLARRFKEEVGMSVGSYIQIVRISKSKELLRFTSKTVEEISYETGYGGDSNYFSRVFKKVEGCSPSEFRRNWMSGNKVAEEEE